MMCASVAGRRRARRRRHSRCNTVPIDTNNGPRAGSRRPKKSFLGRSRSSCERGRNVAATWKACCTATRWSSPTRLASVSRRRWRSHSGCGARMERRIAGDRIDLPKRAAAPHAASRPAGAALGGVGPTVSSAAGARAHPATARSACRPGSPATPRGSSTTCSCTSSPTSCTPITGGPSRPSSLGTRSPNEPRASCSPRATTSTDSHHAHRTHRSTIRPCLIRSGCCRTVRSSRSISSRIGGSSASRSSRVFRCSSC